jgi:hypothetical protein
LDQTVFLPSGTSFPRQDGFDTEGTAGFVQGNIGGDVGGSGSVDGNGSGSFLTPQEYLFADEGLSQEMSGEYASVEGTRVWKYEGKEKEGTVTS